MNGSTTGKPSGDAATQNNMGAVGTSNGRDASQQGADTAAGALMRARCWRALSMIASLARQPTDLIFDRARRRRARRRAGYGTPSVDLKTSSGGAAQRRLAGVPDHSFCRRYALGNRASAEFADVAAKRSATGAMAPQRGAKCCCPTMCGVGVDLGRFGQQTGLLYSSLRTYDVLPLGRCLPCGNLR